MLAHVATAALYDSKLKAICARVRHWSRYDLSLLGRAHVAKQVLASTLSYHATFLPPPPDTLAKISRILSGYVMRNQLVEDGGPPLRGRPSKLVMSLPVELGGLALVDLEAHTQALRAKVLAMLLHPKWLPWKGLMTASFGRAFPGLGLAACVQHCLPTRVTVGLPQRHAAYLQAFRQLGAHRSVGHLSMTKEQIALEPLQGNHSVLLWPRRSGYNKTISISILRMRVFCLLLRSFFLLLEVCTGPEISAI